MNSAAQTLIATLFISACAMGPNTTALTAPISFDSSRDLIVIGKLANQDYQRVDIADDLIGHGWITADLRVTRTLRGKPPSQVLKIQYFAHTYLSEDQRVKLHLRRKEDNSYSVCAPAGSNGLQCN